MAKPAARSNIPLVYLVCAIGAFFVVVGLGFTTGFLKNLSEQPSSATFLRSLFLLPLPVVLVMLAQPNPNWGRARWPLLIACIGVSTFYLPGLIIAGMSIALAWMLRGETWLSDVSGIEPSPVSSKQWVVVAGIIVLGWAFRLLSLNEPFERDLMVYAMVASSWLEGAPLYSGVWDHKPPALYVAYAGAMAVFGQTPWAIFALNCVFFAVTLIGVHRAAALFAGARAAFFAIVIWAFCGSDLILQANQPNVEVFLNACLVWVLVLFLAYPEKAPGWGRVCLAGVLFFIASAFKQIAVFPAAFIAVALILNARPVGAGGLRGLLNSGLTRALVLAAIGVVGWLLIFATFQTAGTFADFYYAVFGYNKEYAGSLLGSIADGFSSAPFALYFCVFIVFGGCHVLRGHMPRHRLLAAAYLGTFLMFAMPGKYFPHYYQLFLPLIAISGGWILAGAFPEGRCGRVIATLFAPIWITFGFMTSPERIAYMKYHPDGHGHASVESKEIGLWLAGQGEEMPVVLHWGAEPGIFFWSGKPTVYKFPFNYPLIKGSLREEMSQEFIAQVSCAPADVVVVNKIRRHHMTGSAWTFVQEHYEPEQDAPVYDNFEIWKPKAKLPDCT